MLLQEHCMTVHSTVHQTIVHAVVYYIKCLAGVLTIMCCYAVYSANDIPFEIELAGSSVHGDGMQLLLWFVHHQ